MISGDYHADFTSIFYRYQVENTAIACCVFNLISKQNIAKVHSILDIALTLVNASDKLNALCDVNIII